MVQQKIQCCRNCERQSAVCERGQDVGFQCALRARRSVQTVCRELKHNLAVSCTHRLAELVGQRCAQQFACTEPWFPRPVGPHRSSCRTQSERVLGYPLQLLTSLFACVDRAHLICCRMACPRQLSTKSVSALSMLLFELASVCSEEPRCSKRRAACVHESRCFVAVSAMLSQHQSRLAHSITIDTPTNRKYMPQVRITCPAAHSRAYLVHVRSQGKFDTWTPPDEFATTILDWLKGDFACVLRCMCSTNSLAICRPLDAHFRWII